jgi:hypothetical protein
MLIGSNSHTINYHYCKTIGHQLNESMFASTCHGRRHISNAHFSMRQTIQHLNLSNGHDQLYKEHLACWNQLGHQLNESMFASTCHGRRHISNAHFSMRQTIQHLNLSNRHDQLYKEHLACWNQLGIN